MARRSGDKKQNKKTWNKGKFTSRSGELFQWAALQYPISSLIVAMPTMFSTTNFFPSLLLDHTAPSVKFVLSVTGQAVQLYLLHYHYRYLHYHCTDLSPPMWYCLCTSCIWTADTPTPITTRVLLYCHCLNSTGLHSDRSHCPVHFLNLMSFL